MNLHSSLSLHLPTLAGSFLSSLDKPIKGVKEFNASLRVHEMGLGGDTLRNSNGELLN